MTLTKDAKTVLYKLYKEYSDRRKHGFTKSDSKNFINAEEIQKNFFQTFCWKMLKTPFVNLVGMIFLTIFMLMTLFTLADYPTLL